MGDIVEAMARAIAGFYGPNFDECLPTRQIVKHEATHGRADINDNDQELHYYAARAAFTTALDHMREPSEGVITAVYAACHNHWPDARKMAVAMNRAIVDQLRKETLK